MQKLQGTKKVINYLYEFIDSDFFQSEIKRIRNKYNIPENGIKEYDKDLIKNLLFIYVPKESIFYKNSENYKLLNLDLQIIKNRFPIKHTIFNAILRVYLFHNIVLEELFNESYFTERNMCLLTDDMEELKKYRYGDDNKEIGFLYIEERGRQLQDYPISISINPNTTRRDLSNFIDQMFPKIKALQEKYKNNNSKLGKIRTKNTKKKGRDDFIYEHRHLSRKEIVKLVLKRFPNDNNLCNPIDIGSVGKIISLQKKKRKQV